MGNFKYVAMTAAGEKVKGKIEALDQKDAVAQVRKAGYTPVEIKEEGRIVSSKVFASFFRRIPPEELLIFYLQLNYMISAGINILLSLESIEEQVQNEKLKNAIQDIVGRIKKGGSFSEALEQHRDVFSDLFINMMKSGEESGKLDVVLGSYAILYEEQLDLRRKVEGVLFYPIVLFCVGLAVILFLVAFIMPRFVSIFSDAGVQLPLPTRILFIIGTAIIHYWYLMVIGVFLACMGIWRYVRTSSGRLKVDTIKLLLPVIGQLNREIALSRFSNTLGMLLQSGVPIIKSLELAVVVMQNVVMEGAIKGLPKRMEKGESLSVVMKTDGMIPTTMIQMIAAGEEAGNLGDMLKKAGAFYAKAVENTMKKLTVMIEPIFLLIMGGTVGLIMASIMLPLFKMINIVGM